MSILVEYYGTGGIGTTPTFQQVLTAGSNLTQQNVIDGNNSNLIYRNGEFSIGKSLIDDYYFNFYQDASNNNTTFDGYDNGTNTGISIDLKNRIYKFGDLINACNVNINGASQTISLNCGFFDINTTGSADFTSSSYTLNEYAGSAILEFKGLNWEQPSSSGAAPTHLKVRVNGTNYVIALRYP
jgi:hypothetical protein